MDNQHAKISGYRDLTEEEIGFVNLSKAREDELAVLLGQIQTVLDAAADAQAGRWLSLARTHFETGFMFANKAIMRPTNGLGRK